MRSSKTEREWNSNEDKVMAANGGDHPEFWDTKIIDSGLAKEVGRAITAKEELDRKNALRARQREKGY